MAQYHRAEALAALGHTVHVLVVKAWRPGRSRLWSPPIAAGVSTELVQHPSVPRLRFAELSLAMLSLFVAVRYRQVVQRQAYDVVHVHTERMALAVGLHQRPLKLPTLVSLHAADSTPQIVRVHCKRRRLARALGNADHVVLVGDVLKRYFGPCLNPASTTTLHNGFKLEKDSGPDPTRWQGAMRLVSVSRLFEGKGLHLVLQALAQLRPGLDWTYEVIGSGPEESRLQTLAAQLGVADRVTFLGPLPHEVVMKRLASAEVFVLPSFYEAFGVAHLEAMAAGCLTIGVDGQGPSEFIESGRTGYLVPPRDVDSIVEVLRAVIADPDSSRLIAEAGQRTARSEKTWDAHARALETIYAGLIN
ncbi:glycosyltransferase family 4 protein [Nocardioides perillae]